MKAVHFGAGNIGRGFIGALLYESNYETVFLDVNGTVVDALNERKSYDVTLMGTEQQAIHVEKVRGINTLSHPAEGADAIVQSDLVTAAVGPKVLPMISSLIAEGLRVRFEKNPQPLNIIACENMINASSLLKEHVYTHLTELEKETADRLIGFPNAAVDRIVPDQASDDVLAVAVEPYYEWVVEKPALKGEVPAVEGITYVDDLSPFIERKLFTVNTGHTVPAYFGRYKGFQTIFDAMQDEEIEELLRGALSETGEVIIQEHGFDRAEHEAYIQKIIGRFQNPNISDHVTRVGRGPLRKLGKNDRLIRPASLYWQLTGKEPVHLATVIAAVLLYVNDEDPEAKQLQEMIAAQGFEKTLQEVAELEADDPLIPIIMKRVEELQRK